jgi:DNA-binding CsgD family transcriptional regulator
MGDRYMGLALRPHPAKGVNSQIVCEMYKGGMSTPEIAKELGVSKASVLYHLAKGGQKLRSISEAVKLKIERGQCHIGGKGEFNPAWRGGRYKDIHGYILVYQPGHHKQIGRHYVYEHVLIWEKVHNQPLPDGWIIHHLNGKKDDNRPENLVACPNKNHYDFIKALQNRIAELENKVRIEDGR